ncbi:hypothetical protein [Aquipseudomonas alcaligenes]|uniref:Uncharacterized protein n=1 Tax=Aquipseudomonas alcaligenes TaxID=43263 RepID=A0A1N6V1M4_AQUAC|nr:hypothetical protein [Pseudomonas alcaligenes]SIQ71813.1 hypothetical protein SAMN05878282_10772 [Pseudomonas alcaligenes]
MDPQEIGLLVLPAILFIAFVINYFDERFKSGSGQFPQRSADSQGDRSTRR